MNTKYELTDETREFHGATLHRIRALKDFGKVKKGDLGGWIESEKNLSIHGNCWVFDDAVVFDDANVSDNAVIYNDSCISSRAEIMNECSVHGNSYIGYDAIIMDGAKIHNCRIGGYAMISTNGVIDNCDIHDDAYIRDNVSLYNKVTVSGNSVIYGDAIIKNGAYIFGDARIGDSHDYIVITGPGCEGITVTFFKSTDSIDMSIGENMLGTIDDVARYIKKYERNVHGKEYLQMIKLAKRYFKNRKK